MEYNIINVENNHTNLVLDSPSPRLCNNPPILPTFHPTPEVLRFLQATKNKTKFQRLRAIWTEIRDDQRKMYCKIDSGTPWKIQVNAVFREGIRIYSGD